MSRHINLVLCICLCCCAAHAESQESHPSVAQLVIATTLKYDKGTFPRDKNWQGLYCKMLDCEIIDVKVAVTTSSAKNVLDEDEYFDVLSVNGEPLALFPLASFKLGKVTTWYRATDSSYESGQYLKLKKLGKWQMPWGAQPLTISWVKTPEGLMRYHISDGVTKQFMFMLDSEGHYGGDTIPVILWGGDLDGDGKIDILLSIPDDNCGFDERLYLSSNAGNGKLLYKAAQLTGREAACGC